MTLQLFDSHAHLNSERFIKDAKETRERAFENGVVGVLNVAYDEASSLLAVQQSEELKNTWAAVGMHPHDAKDYNDEIEEKIRQWSNHPNVVAIGEMGLDYYYNHSPKEVQREVFIRQMELAKEVGLPIIIHDRDAHGECLELVQTYGKGLQGVFHCFSGSKEFAKEVLKVGFYVSFAGPVTYKNAKHVKEAAESIPLDRLLVETDSPYLTPEPYRGQRNEPMHVRQVAEEIARLRGMSVEEIALQTTKNACTLFNVTI